MQTALDDEIDTSLKEIERKRKAKLALTIGALILAGGGMLALTSLMYTSTPGDVSEDRIGEESFR